MKLLAYSLFIILSTISVFSQKSEYSITSIPDSLKQNANAVIRLDQTDIRIESQRSMTITEKRVVTVFNEKGMNAIGAVEFYDKRTSVKNIEAIVYDGFGTEIKKIRKKDFRDQSAVDGSTLFSDSRLIYLDYTPTQYPFTIIYECETATSNTAFIPQWLPLKNYFVGVEKSVLNVTYPEHLGFKKKEVNFSGFSILMKSDSTTQLSYQVVNIPPQKEEYYSQKFYDIFPVLMMGLELFHLEGVDGNAKNWKEFGQWYSEKILSGTLDLPEETKTKILALVGNEKDPIQKAKIIYNYVQQKSRYVSIQVGIGGWKPMLAKDVDRLGYGDCKALTNYTKALLEIVGVPAYDTVLYGAYEKRNIQSDFVSMQGNHMILTIPNGNDYVFLECTSQDDPFGYQANFTDDRNVLIMKPEGGEIIRTKNYQDKDNSQISAGNYTISENGNFFGNISMVSQGSQYRKSRLQSKLPTEKESHYKEYWSNINSLKINKITFVNDKEKVTFTENLELSAANYGTITGNKMMIPVNAFNQSTANIKRIRNRKTPFEIERGFYDSDEIKIVLPAEFTIETLPKGVAITSKFGEYTTELTKNENGNLVYKRHLLIQKGKYPNSDYEEYRLFMEQISRNDNAKIILTKNQ